MKNLQHSGEGTGSLFVIFHLFLKRLLIVANRVVLVFHNLI